MTLTLEIKDRPAETGENIAPGISITPPIDEDYWTYRVRLSETQAIVGFPKFGTIGIGFAAEEDWNTNLPYRLPASEIFEHIRKNKGDDAISDENCLAAIRMIQAAARTDREEAEPPEDANPCGVPEADTETEA